MFVEKGWCFFSKIACNKGRSRHWGITLLCFKTCEVSLASQSSQRSLTYIVYHLHAIWFRKRIPYVGVISKAALYLWSCPGYTVFDLSIRVNCIYYMANPVLDKSLCSDWFFLGQDFAVLTVSMETVQSVYFCFGAKPANLKICNQNSEEKVWIMSFFTLKLSEENKKIKNFPKFRR